MKGGCGFSRQGTLTILPKWDDLVLNRKVLVRCSSVSEREKGCECWCTHHKRITNSAPIIRLHGMITFEVPDIPFGDADFGEDRVDDDGVDDDGSEDVGSDETVTVVLSLSPRY